MNIEEKYVCVQNALNTMESEYVENKDDKLFLDKKYGPKFNNFFERKTLSQKGLISILQNNFNIEINDRELQLFLKDYISTNHLEVIKSINIKDRNNYCFEIHFI